MIFRVFGQKIEKKHERDEGLSPAKGRLMRLVTLVFVLTIVAVGIYLINGGLRDLESLSFSTGNQEGFANDDRELSFREGDVFTVLLLLTDASDADKSKIENFAVVRINQEENSAIVFSMNPEVYFYPTGYIGNTDFSVGVDRIRIKDLMVVGQLNTPP